MSSNIVALSAPNHAIPVQTENGDAAHVPEYSFSELWQNEKEGLTFGDVLDIINPLQHLPIISSIYQAATNDDIGMGSKLIGGALFGGPIGLIITGARVVFEEMSGGTLEEHVATLWDTITDDGDNGTNIAATDNTAPPSKAPLPIEDDYAAVATQPAQQPIALRAEPVANQASAHTNITLLQRTNSPAQSALQQLARPPVTVSPLTAIHRVHSQPQPTLSSAATSEQNAESQRIAKAIELAQRAQAGLLLASLGAVGSDKPQDNTDRAALQPAQPFEAHPYMLPRGAPPQQISRAMEQALAKYQLTLQRQATPTNALPVHTNPVSIK
jgi:hypothetical protein